MPTIPSRMVHFDAMKDRSSDNLGGTPSVEASVSSLISHWKMVPSSVAASEDKNRHREVAIGGGGEKYRAVEVDDADDGRGSMAKDDIVEAAQDG